MTPGRVEATQAGEPRDQALLLDLHRRALDAVGHGLCMYDADLRIVLCNRRFLDLFGLTAELAAPGTPMRDILASIAERCDFNDTPFEENWQRRLEDLTRRAPFDRRQVLPDGRILDIHYTPMDDGGWLGTHTDVSERHILEDELRQQVARFDQALGNMAHGLAMYGPDERLIVCNAKYLADFGFDPAVVKPGISLREAMAHLVERGVYAGITGEKLYEESHRRLVEAKSCDYVRRLADGRYLSIRNRPMAGGGWVITSEDISEHEKAAAELRDYHDRFDAALNNMSQGLCMFDADHRLIVCNDAYVTIFSADREVVKPGVTLNQVFQHGVSKGIYPSMTADELVERRLAALADGTTRTYDQPMADGRLIKVSLSPMQSGGWVGIFEDVTELRRVEAERASAVAAVREQNLLLDATLESMEHGLCVFDRDLRVVVRNRRYMDIYGLDPETSAPGTPMIDLVRESVRRGVHLPGRDAEGICEDFKLFLIDRREPILHRRLADGRMIAVRIQPMANGGWVATFEDVTVMQDAMEELREQYRRFDAALNNMAHGLAMLDEDLNLIVCNKRYLDMYRLSPEVVRPGATMRAIVEHSVMLGNYKDAAADDILAGYHARLRAGDYVSHRTLADGRIFKVVYQAMEHGGWVAIHEDVTERHKAEQHIAHMAHHDALTDLPNRVLFREQMAEGLRRVAATGGTLALLCLDLDHFKGINDTLGHPVGDRLLRAVSERLSAVVAGEGTIARLGGDEFAVLAHADGPASAEALARRLVALMNEPLVVDGHVINSTISVGVALAPRDGTGADALMKSADLALYRAKGEGRGTYRFFEPDMGARIQARRELEIDLRQALAAGQFHLMFQPQVKADSELLNGFEALLRWNHPQRGFVSPVEFIPLAEETGLILPIGEWVLREACLEAARWPEPVKVAINLSPVQFKNRGLVGLVMNALATAGLPPSRLELEITEAVLLENDEATIAMLHDLRALGIRIAMDDFGIGYSSLSYLRSFPFDKIKIDRSFIADIDSNEDNVAIIRAMAGLGASLGVDTTAEGVETAEQLAIIRNCGCTEAQGYLFSAPRTAAEARLLMGRGGRRVAAA